MTFNIEVAWQKATEAPKGGERKRRSEKKAATLGGKASARRFTVCMRCLKMRAWMMEMLAWPAGVQEKVIQRELENFRSEREREGRGCEGRQRKECVKVFFCIEFACVLLLLLLL